MRLHKQVRFILVYTLPFIVAFPPANIFAEPDNCAALGHYCYRKVIDKGPGKRIRGYVSFGVPDSPELQGVLTLKHLDTQGDWDLLVGTHFDENTRTMHGAIDYKNNSGNVNELLWLPGNSSKQYIVVAYSKSSQPSAACVIFHRFDSSEILGQALIMATAHSVLVEIFSDENDSQESKNSTSRVVAGGLSVLNRNNVALMGYDMVLNEVSTQLANAFGGGSWMFTFGVNYFGGYLEQSVQYLANNNIRCSN